MFESWSNYSGFDRVALKSSMVRRFLFPYSVEIPAGIGVRGYVGRSGDREERNENQRHFQ